MEFCIKLLKVIRVISTIISNLVFLMPMEISLDLTFRIRTIFQAKFKADHSETHRRHPWLTSQWIEEKVSVKCNKLEADSKWVLTAREVVNRTSETTTNTICI